MLPSQTTTSDCRLYTGGQVRELDRIAIQDHGISGEELMERAGRAAFESIRERFPGLDKWLVLCGGGNNGGDGYVIARLAYKTGIDIHVLALKSPGDLKGDAASAAQRWMEAGGTVESDLTAGYAGFELFVDALLGTGLDRAPQGSYADAIRAANACGARRAAIDIPSGIHADTGVALGKTAFLADLTVTFIGRKRGLFTADGPDHTGDVVFSDLDVPAAVFDVIPEAGTLLLPGLLSEMLPPRKKNSHKGSYGWLLGIGGDRGMSGAIRLCGEAALRCGAGKVTLLTHPDHAANVNACCPELMVRGVGGGGDSDDLIQTADVIALGAGLGQSAWSESLLQVCHGLSKPVVLDADALNLLAAGNSIALFSDQPAGLVMTPHPAEAGRLLGVDSQSVQADRVSAALELAKSARAVVVLKGCGTVVAEPGGRYAICALGNPGMASAGTGDVLTGVIGALLAQGLSAWEAATGGVVAHALAGDFAAAKMGERGLLASDIITQLPFVLNPR